MSKRNKIISLALEVKRFIAEYIIRETFFPSNDLQHWLYGASDFLKINLKGNFLSCLSLYLLVTAKPGFAKHSYYRFIFSSNYFDLNWNWKQPT